MNSSIVNTRSGFSVAAWVYLNNLNNYYTAVSQDGNSISGFYLQYHRGDNRFRFGMSTGDSTSASGAGTESTSAPSPGVWYHLVGVRDLFNNQIRLYVNGTLQATVSLSNGFLSSGHLIIGAAKYGGNRVDYFNGLIDDVRVYNYGLSDSEVANLYNGGAGRATVLSAQSGTTPNQSTQVRPTFQPPTNTPSR